MSNGAYNPRGYPSGSAPEDEYDTYYQYEPEDQEARTQQALEEAKKKAEELAKDLANIVTKQK